MLKTYGRRRSNLDNERQQGRPNKRRKISIELATEEEDSSPNQPQPSLRRTKTEVFDEPTRGESSQPSPRGAQSEPNIVVRTVSRTYSGPSRSYLAPQPTLFDDDPGDDDESYADRRARWGVDDSDDLLRLPANMMNDLKSITELRSSGESRRFLDQVGYLFEGMVPEAAVGLRKTSGVELVGKMTDDDFVRKAKAADFFGRIWEALCNAGSDKIFDILQVLFGVLLSKDSVSLSYLAPKLIPNLCTILGRTSSIDLFHLISIDASDAELRKAGLVRTEKALVTSIRSILTKADLQGVSLPLLISRILVDMSTPSIHPSILQSLKTSLETIHTRIDSYSSGLPLTVPTGLMPHITNCLRIIDSSLLRHKEVDMPGMVWSRPLMELCFVCERRTDADLDAAPCLEMALRVLVSLSHEDVEWGEALLSDPFTAFLVRTTVKSRPGNDEGKEKAVEESDSGVFDRSCLALGILTNLAHSASSPRMKDQIRLCRLDTTCKLGRECLGVCQCSPSNQKSALSILALHFQSYSSSDTLRPPAPIAATPTSATTSSDTFIRCHLSILLGLFMRHSAANQSLVLSSVQIEQLKSSAREFVEVSTMLKGGDGDGEGADVVKDVVGFLEHLDN